MNVKPIGKKLSKYTQDYPSERKNYGSASNLNPVEGDRSDIESAIARLETAARTGQFDTKKNTPESGSKTEHGTPKKAA